MGFLVSASRDCGGSCQPRSGGGGGATTRKPASLALVAVIVAGAVLCMPGAVSTADAQVGRNANLFVSAEDATFGNALTGQVVEVVIRDNQIDDLDEALGEPDVYINGDDLRMVQANDGNWYAYFAVLDMAKAVDGDNGNGIDFGVICEDTSATAATSTAGVKIGTGTTFIDLAEIDAVALPLNQNVACPTGAQTTADLVGADDTNNTGFNVVREPKDINTNDRLQAMSGQIGLNTSLWPFVQLYDIQEDNTVEVRYSKGGGDQTVSLTYETAGDYDSLEVDRAENAAPTSAVYPRSAHVHVTITDTSLDIDPTDLDTWTWNTTSDGGVYYRVFDDNGRFPDGSFNTSNEDLSDKLGDLLCEECQVTIENNPAGNPVLTVADNNDNRILGNSLATSYVAGATADTILGPGTQPFTVVETGPQTGIFVSYDEQDVSSLQTTADATRAVISSIDYDDPVSITFQAATATIDIDPGEGEWNSGTPVPVTLIDRDMNKNGRDDEDILVSDPGAVIPTLVTGDPFTLAEGGSPDYKLTAGAETHQTKLTVESFSDRAVIDPTSRTEASTSSPTAVGATIPAVTAGGESVVLDIDLDATAADLKQSINDTADRGADFRGFNYLNIDVTSFGSGNGDVDVMLLSSATSVLDDSEVTATTLVENQNPQGKYLLEESVVTGIFGIQDTMNIGLRLALDDATIATEQLPFVVDFFSYGFTDDGASSSERIANQIIRLELEESGDDTSTFEGTLEYHAVNQLTVLDRSTHDRVAGVGDNDGMFVTVEALADEDAPRVNYLDLGSDGVRTQISDQEAAPTRSGTIAFDAETYNAADTVTVTLIDSDLNADSELVDVFTAVDADDPARDSVGAAGLADKNKGDAPFSFGALGRLVDVTFNDERWTAGNAEACADNQNESGIQNGLASTGFTMRETGIATGTFVGNFRIPATYCSNSGSATPVSAIGTNMGVNYVDFRNAAGEIVEVGDSAGVRPITGSVSLDRAVYPVPWGGYVPGDNVYSGNTPGATSAFPVHATVVGSSLDNADETLGDGSVVMRVRIHDPDFNTSKSGRDQIAQNTAAGVGPLKIAVSRGAEKVTLGYAGGATSTDGKLDVGDDGAGGDFAAVKQLGPITEVASNAGIFELYLEIAYTDGPSSSACPVSDRDGDDDANGRMDAPAPAGENYCILHGDILTVEYTDPADSSGGPNTVLDSATFDLRNGALQSDKGVYIIGTDMILTITEPDWNLNSDAAETYSLNAVEWDSSAGTLGLGQGIGSGGAQTSAFNPEPNGFRETGDNTGIFQVVLEVPEALYGDRLERGEEIELEYTDWGPSGANYVGEEDEDVNLTVFTYNFGATVELDQKVYSWTDKVFITIVAPDHNFDSQLIDEIGETSSNAIRISTRSDDIDRYKLVETGTDTGVFTGEVILTGFPYDADGDDQTGQNGVDTNPRTSPDGSGPTDGFLRAQENEGLSVSFEFSEDETVVGSALIRWNVGVVEWLESTYPAHGTGVVRVADPDMNLNLDAADAFDVDVWSDSDPAGISLTVAETDDDTGIFEGTVSFTTTDESSGHTLRVAAGDAITAKYYDYTLPAPAIRGDQQQVSSASVIGDTAPPPERVPVHARPGSNANLFVSAEDATFGNAMTGQVVEVVVRDDQIDDLDETLGEPDVFINGDDLRMAQANDGNWYAYFAVLSMATSVDGANGNGIDFGVICDDTSATGVKIGTGTTTVDLSEIDAVALPLNHGAGCPATPLASATATNGDAGASGFNVVREAKELNTNAQLQGMTGQIGLHPSFWPFVQLYDIGEDDAVQVEYRKGGGNQTVNLQYETAEDYDSLEVDRAENAAPTHAVYPRSAQVHVTITDTSLDIDPTDLDTWTWNTTSDGGVYYRVFDDSGAFPGGAFNASNEDLSDKLDALLCEECQVTITNNPSGNPVLTVADNNDNRILGDSLATSYVAGATADTILGPGTQPFTVVETGPQTGVFVSYDAQDISSLQITDDATRAVVSTIDYDDPVSVTFQAATATIDIDPGEGEWSPGTPVPVTLIDRDMNKNGRDTEYMLVSDPGVVIPTLVTGDPFTLADGASPAYKLVADSSTHRKPLEVERFSDRAVIDPASGTDSGGTAIPAVMTSPNGGSVRLDIDLGQTAAELKRSIHDPADGGADFRGFNYLNIDVTSFGSGNGDVDVLLLSSTTSVLAGGAAAATLAEDKNPQGTYLLGEDAVGDVFAVDDAAYIGLRLVLDDALIRDERLPFVADFFSYGFTDDGASSSERIASQIIRLELEESGDNTSTFEGSLEYHMVNQLTILDRSTYDGVAGVGDDAAFVAIEDLAYEDAPRINYLDIGSDGVEVQISDQEAAPTRSGAIGFDSEAYTVADTVTVTLTDADLDADSELVDVFTAVDADDPARDSVGAAGLPDRNKANIPFSFGALGRLVYVTFNDEHWTADSQPACVHQQPGGEGLASAGLTLRETGADTGTFVGNFRIPATYCSNDSVTPVSVIGADMDVNYVDFRDISGEIVEVGDSAGVRANTGSVSLDRAVYPVPWGGYVPGDDVYSGSTPGAASAFPVHAAVVGPSIDNADETLGEGSVSMRARINDPDFDRGPGEDKIAQNTAAGVGPLKITVSRGAEKVTLGYAGGATATDGKLDVGDDGAGGDYAKVRRLGPMTEVAGSAGIFEIDLEIAYTDGPSSSACPVSDRDGDDDANGRMDAPAPAGENYCILQGDVLTVEYADPADASGGPNTVTDSATFDLRNGVLQSDKAVYTIGHDMILTIIEPDWNLDGDDAETYGLNAVAWDSESGTLGLGQGVGSGGTQTTAFDPEPGRFYETGDDTGIFQVVLAIPEALHGNRLDRGEEIELEYTDWGPSGANYVGETAEDVNLTIFTSNFGATVELDQKAYSWTDKVFITVVAPDHNSDIHLIDEIGATSSDAIRVFTRSDAIDGYKLVETGTDTGIFTGEVILTGFPYDADGDEQTGANGIDTSPRTSPGGSGPAGGLLRTTDNDFISVSFAFSENETIVGSSIIWWNVGVVEWLESSYSASGAGVVRVADPDMNLNPEAADDFDVDVWSDSDPGGIRLTVTETGDATGIFEGTVFFTDYVSSGHVLRAAEGDTITARYNDYTLPAPATRGDQQPVSSTYVIGDTAPPPDRAPVSSIRVVDLEPLRSGRVVQTGSGPAVVTPIPLIDDISRITFAPSGLYAIALDLSSLTLADSGTKSSLCALAGPECAYLGTAKTTGPVTVETGMDLVTRVVLPDNLQIVGLPPEGPVHIYEAEQRRAQQALGDADFASDPAVGGYDVASAQAAELGGTSSDLIFSSFVRVFFDPSVLYEGTLVFSVDSAGDSKILTSCGSDPAAALAALRPSATVDGLACVDYDSSSIWTRHFTAFGVAPPLPTEPAPLLINRGGGGGGGGGGVSGAAGAGAAVPVYIRSVSWDCEAGTVKVEAGPDDDGLTVTVLSKTLGLSAAELQDGDAAPGHLLFEAPMDSDDDFIQVKALSVGGREFSSATESLNLNSCAGTRIFQAQAPAEPNPPVQSAPPALAAVPDPTKERPPAELGAARGEPERAAPEEPAIGASEQAAGDQAAGDRAPPAKPECGPGTALSSDGICRVVQDSSGCLIATAAHGTELAPQIQRLREIRDGKVLSTGSGTAFMDAFSKIYYSFSPAVADAERQNPALRHAAAAALAPMLATLHVMDFAKEGSEAHVAGLGALVIALNAAVYGSPAALAAALVRARRTRRASR